MKTMVTVIASLMMVVLSGCSPNEMTLQPTVIIDADFGPRGTQEVIDGLDAWSSVVPDVKPRFVIWPHISAMVKSSGKSLPPNTVFVIAVRGNTVSGCPAGGALGGSLGRNRRTKNGSSVFCVDIGPPGTPEADPDDHSHRQVASHEFGHALGIPDARSLPKRLMYWLSDDNQLPLPSCDDGRAVADHWGVDVAEDCKWNPTSP